MNKEESKRGLAQDKWSEDESDRCQDSHGVGKAGEGKFLLELLNEWFLEKENLMMGWRTYWTKCNGKADPRMQSLVYNSDQDEHPRKHICIQSIIILSIENTTRGEI